VFESCSHDPLHIYVGDDVVKPVWQQDFHLAHEHNEAVTSVGISVPGDLDGKRLNDWISELLRTKGGDIYRMKGVLAVKGTNKRLVFQGVHMLFDAQFDREWAAGELRSNTLVFIGKNLDRAKLNEAFKACLG
jgi:G3E family GTPase